MKMINRYIFVLTEEQLQNFNEWRATKPEIYVGAIGGAYTFEFTPTGIGMVVKVKCADGTELDLTDDFGF
jgi:hypothetical protein